MENFELFKMSINMIYWSGKCNTLKTIFENKKNTPKINNIISLGLISPSNFVQPESCDFFCRVCCGLVAMASASGPPAMALQSSEMLSRDQLLHLFARFDSLTSQPGASRLLLVPLSCPSHRPFNFFFLFDLALQMSRVGSQMP